MIAPILIIIGYITLATSIAVYIDTWIEWQPYISKGSKVYINKIPYWF